MSDLFYLAWCYLNFHRVKAVVLICATTLIVYVPVALNTLISESASAITSRATATPLLVGAKGSPLELVLSSLYFESDSPPPLHFSEVDRVRHSKLARAIPLDIRFQTRHSPIVGTSLEYFTFRGLGLKHGRKFHMLGECVLGARAAQIAGVKPGDTVMSKPENVFNFAGTYPLKMHVVGVLEPTGTPDDLVVFVDVRTTWVIEGLGHGHRNLKPSAEQESSGSFNYEKPVTHSTVTQFNEVTSENEASFHFHGDMQSFPITAVIAVPNDSKSATLLEGKYFGEEEVAQIVRPVSIMRELLHTILTVQRYVVLAGCLLVASTLGTMTLVFMLSVQLRRREMATIRMIGGTRWRIAALVATEIVSVLTVGTVFAAGLAYITSWLSPWATQVFIRLM
ncbi:MAG: ABC transporter permease [Planctomycetaceae bacterium]|nr:ABC transporter permease [Planctomycetales bacterium]MCB9922994.1 ABC transporter permease [Planctomycetaceae bacterium]